MPGAPVGRVARGTRRGDGGYPQPRPAPDLPAPRSPTGAPDAPGEWLMRAPADRACAGCWWGGGSGSGRLRRCWRGWPGRVWPG
jgi:hypothetical protein